MKAFWCKVDSLREKRIMIFSNGMVQLTKWENLFRHSLSRASSMSRTLYLRFMRQVFYQCASPTLCIFDRLITSYKFKNWYYFITLFYKLDHLEHWNITIMWLLLSKKEWENVFKKLRVRICILKNITCDGSLKYLNKWKTKHF